MCKTSSSPGRPDACASPRRTALPMHMLIQQHACAEQQALHNVTLLCQIQSCDSSFHTGAAFTSSMVSFPLKLSGNKSAKYSDSVTWPPRSLLEPSAPTRTPLLCAPNECKLERLNDLFLVLVPRKFPSDIAMRHAFGSADLDQRAYLPVANACNRLGDLSFDLLVVASLMIDVNMQSSGTITWPSWLVSAQANSRCDLLALVFLPGHSKLGCFSPVRKEFVQNINISTE